MGLGWKNALGSGKGGDTTSSGIEGAWTPNPTQWDNGYFDMLFGYDWNLVKSPSGAWQWVPVNVADKDLAPGRARSVEEGHHHHDHGGPVAAHGPDLRPISRRFHKDPQAFADAFARAWFKLTHRDLGRARATSAPRCQRRCWSGRTRCPPWTTP
jgi:catalase-peroxidase